MNREKWKNRVIDPVDSFRPSPNSAPIGFNKSGCHRTKEKEANWKVISCGINLGPRSPLSRNRGESADAEGRSSTIIDINVVSFKGLRKSEYVWIARNYLSYSISIFSFPFCLLCQPKWHLIIDRPDPSLALHTRGRWVAVGFRE